MLSKMNYVSKVDLFYEPEDESENLTFFASIGDYCREKRKRKAHRTFGTRDYHLKEELTAIKGCE